MGPGNVFDGNLNTYWEDENSIPGSGAGWVQMDYGSETTNIINNYSVSDDPFGPVGPTTWTLQGSNDAISWTPLIHVPESHGLRATKPNISRQQM